MSKVFAVPVKYMVVKSIIGYKIIDTSFEGQGKRMGWFLRVSDSHKIAQFMNNLEGYQYRY